MAPLRRYRAYGLTLRSTRPIPGLLPLPSDAPSAPEDVTVHWGASYPGDAPGASAAAPPSWERLHASDLLDEEHRPLFTLDRAAGDGRRSPPPAEGTGSPILLRLAYSDATTFWLQTHLRVGEPQHAGASGATEVWAHWPDDLTSEDASTYFLGPVLGYLLRMRGQTVLHASAVGLAPVGTPQSGAVALVGPPGAGKSTTAAAFSRRGHLILTEDACALEEPEADIAHGAEGSEAHADAPFRVLPGYPLVRLWPESVEILYGRPDALPLLTPTWDKRHLPLEGTGIFATEPLPLQAIFLLEEREDADGAPRTLSVPPTEAFLRMVANTYRNLVLSPQERVREFQTLHRLLRTTPVYRIIPHADPARLDDLLDLILETATASGA